VLSMHNWAASMTSRLHLTCPTASPGRIRLRPAELDPQSGLTTGDWGSPMWAGDTAVGLAFTIQTVRWSGGYSVSSSESQTLEGELEFQMRKSGTASGGL